MRRAKILVRSHGIWSAPHAVPMRFTMILAQPNTAIMTHPKP